ncbi:diacylglycerol kinase (plasmid) [Kitasatospora sp. NBC_00070]|uniref:diacylglycerol kinase n=1 Tax=Kitasatospora sp. NBC_00070 TaxID=2975962 RepID=UPI002F910D31
MTEPKPGRVLLLVNPHAGDGHAGRAGRLAAHRLRSHGRDVQVLTAADETQTVRHVRAAVHEGCAAVVVAGGDGMIALALQALAGTTVPLGVIPAGTGNDHARAHGLPLDDPEAAADVIAKGHTRAVDLGRIETADGNSRYFGSVMACGFDSLVSDRANRMRRLRGRARYNVAMLVELFGLRPLTFRIVLDEGTEIDGQLTLAAIGNTDTYGGGMAICPGADPADGLLDLTLVKAMPRRTLVRFFPTVFKGTHVRRPEVTTKRTTGLLIESPGVNAYTDGDFAGPLPARVRIHPGALVLFVPAPAGGPAGSLPHNEPESKETP